MKLTVSNSYTGDTTISGGVLQATIGTGIPSGSFLSLTAAFCNSTAHRRSPAALARRAQHLPVGGGRRRFFGRHSALTVNVGNDAHTLVWGTNVGTQLVGPLTLNASTATNTLTFVNGIDLNGGARSLAVDANTVS